VGGEEETLTHWKPDALGGTMNEQAGTENRIRKRNSKLCLFLRGGGVIRFAEELALRRTIIGPAPRRGKEL